MSRLRGIILRCILAASSCAALGCGTMRGLGEDMEKTAEAIQHSFD